MLRNERHRPSIGPLKQLYVIARVAILPIQRVLGRSRVVAADASHRFDHVVVVMFENRSFDHLFGYLYGPNESPGFEGLAGRSLSNPIPPELGGSDEGIVSVHPAENLDTPDPDPGEEYPHINTQLFGIVEPEANATRSVDEMERPFNAPAAPGAVPTMVGFVRDYVNAFRLEMGRAPSYKELAQIMACYTPEQLPVFSTLARSFACFDHWFCEVPTQTYPNRSFFHAATSSGLVLNGPPGSFELRNDAETIFERLEAAGRSWKVYFDPIQMVPATALIHARRLSPFFATRFFAMEDFYDDVRNGTLPSYAFIEPCMIPPHTDMHPPGLGRVRRYLRILRPRPPKGAEALLARIYEAIRNSSNASGSNSANTLLIVTFDEHGGTFDHVPPPTAEPPDPARPPGQMGFEFDRSGVRIPTIAISAWINPRTVVHDVYRSTSVIRTLRERWNLGGPLTRRDATAPDIAPLLNRSTPRGPDDWPRIAVPPRRLHRLFGRFFVYFRPLTSMGEHLMAGALAHQSGSAGRVEGLRAQRRARWGAIRRVRKLSRGTFPEAHRRTSPVSMKP